MRENSKENKNQRDAFLMATHSNVHYECDDRVLELDISGLKELFDVKSVVFKEKRGRRL